MTHIPNNKIASCGHPLTSQRCDVCRREYDNEHYKNNKVSILLRQKQNRIKRFTVNPTRWITERVWQFKTKARLLGVSFNLNLRFLESLVKDQNEVCYYTGIRLVLGGIGRRALPNSASLDRLIPAKGYVKGNVVWCCHFVNTMKGNLNEEEFYNYMHNILKRKSKI